MNHFQTYQVFPNTPKPLLFLETLARNMWWSWNLDAIELFRRIDPRLWEDSGLNPIVFSTMIRQNRLESLAKDDSFLAHMERVKRKFENQILKSVDGPQTIYGNDDIIAYFSMEFGIHESLPLFAGGLGVLSGDHLKASSDLGLPMVGVGLLYRQGYFHQFLDPSGWQQEEYPETDLYHLPVQRAKDPSGNDVAVTVQGPTGPIHAHVWLLMVGRIPLYLLDTNTPENPPAVREITSRLYGGDQKLRLSQEILLGIGGMRALTALGIEPSVCHMNEGHCAFAGLERLATVIKNHNIDLKTALEIVPRSTVFTTHTPVAAGHDEFPIDSVRPYLTPYEEKLGATIREILSWGQAPGSGTESPISMFVLGIRLAQYCNGVSRLHGAVARRMWAYVWPERPEDEVPIIHITNGVHIPSWISVENALLFERYLGPDWYLHTWNKDMSDRIDEIYDEELWRSHEMARSRLIRACRSLMVKQYARRNAPRSMMETAESVLDQEVLTIGFARRFATYKRATLLLQDPNRFDNLLTSSTQPVQIIFAGKAHPNDNEGKELIKRLVEFSRRPTVRNRVVFIEDYDIHLTRHLIQGVDVWLNNPRRPMEACGTSGMKAAANGVLNLSILDGWWCEGYSEDRGWRIGNGEEYDDHLYQDAIESQALYNILENDVIPCFYEKKNGDAPLRWIQMMKASMKMAMQDFCAQCMVRRYEDTFYGEASKQYLDLLQNSAETAKNIYRQRERLNKLWKDIRVQPPERDETGPFRVGDTLKVSAVVELGELRPDEVDVELYYGSMKSVDTLTTSRTKMMGVDEERGNGFYRYTCSVTCDTAGRYGFTARVTPRGDQRIKFLPGLLSWASG
jgi:starch phosphorylase